MPIPQILVDLPNRPEMIFLQFLYDVSDRRIEEEVNFNLVLKWFIGLAIDESPPDASSLTRFRDRLGEEPASQGRASQPGRPRRAAAFARRTGTCD